MRRLFCAGVIVAALCAGPTLAGVVEDAEGVWEYDPDTRRQDDDMTCDGRPLRIEVDAPAKTYRSRRDPAGEWNVADILEVQADRFRIQYRGEERTTEAGEIVEWWFVMAAPDAFYWLRADWPSWGMTDFRLRCHEPLSS